VVAAPTFGILVIRWLPHHSASCDPISASIARRLPSGCRSEDRPCPAQLTSHLDYKETCTASEEEDGHSSAHAELAIFANYSQGLNLTYVPDGMPDFEEVAGVAGASNG
jgi:hypothetical protein